MSGRSDRAKANPGKCPHDCMRPLPGGGICREMCMKKINHPGKGHDCGRTWHA
jgi:hypothetical protein